MFLIALRHYPIELLTHTECLHNKYSNHSFYYGLRHYLKGTKDLQFLRFLWTEISDFLPNDHLQGSLWKAMIVKLVWNQCERAAGLSFTGFKAPHQASLPNVEPLYSVPAKLPLPLQSFLPYLWERDDCLEGEMSGAAGAAQRLQDAAAAILVLLQPMVPGS